MKNNIQPFSYQQSSHSCWIVSFHNAMMAIYGTSYKVPHDMSKLFYNISSDDGVSNRDMETILKHVRDRNRLKIVSFKKKHINRKIIRRHLKKNNTVMICDINSGKHSVLVTDIQEDELIAFDPDWDSVMTGDHYKKKFTCCPYGDEEKNLLNPNHNVSIKIDHLLKDPIHKKDKFVMGDVSKRHVAFISKLK